VLTHGFSQLPRARQRDSAIGGAIDEHLRTALVESALSRRVSRPRRRSRRVVAQAASLPAAGGNGSHGSRYWHSYRSAVSRIYAVGAQRISVPSARLPGLRFR
jgi:hypothetical protein